jgi:ABC-2 type transport system ATP-binding protein
VRIRDFLREYNRRTGATILLTSHYMADVTALCERIIMIHHGQLKYDGSISGLSRRIAPFKLIGVALGNPCPCDLTPYGTPVPADKSGEEDGYKQYVQVPAGEVAHITARMLADLPIHDLTIEDPPIETVIERAFQE